MSSVSTRGHICKLAMNINVETNNKQAKGEGRSNW